MVALILSLSQDEGVAPGFLVPGLVVRQARHEVSG